jgi:hypothetical protein
MRLVLVPPLAAAVWLTLTTSAKAQLNEVDRSYLLTEGDSVPRGYHLEARPQWGWIIGGTVAFAALYGWGAGRAAELDFANQTGWLLVPVAGPWITLLARHNDTGPDSAFSNPLTVIALVADGIMQPFLVGQVISMSVAPPTWAVPNVKQSARLLPYIAKDVAGLQVVGTFR